MLQELSCQCKHGEQLKLDTSILFDTRAKVKNDYVWGCVKLFVHFLMKLFVYKKLCFYYCWCLIDNWVLLAFLGVIEYFIYMLTLTVRIYNDSFIVRGCCLALPDKQTSLPATQQFSSKGIQSP